MLRNLYQSMVGEIVCHFHKCGIMMFCWNQMLWQYLANVNLMLTGVACIYIVWLCLNTVHH